MIKKELDNPVSTDQLAHAGYKAERQMAFYLRRAFAEDKKIFVYNNLRFERNGEVAQIDHLILHTWGMIIVESKSVTSRVEINERGKWSRQWKGKFQGMASPELQAKRQGDLLRNLLRDNDEQLLGKILGLVQAGFRLMPIDILVAVSDEGIIKQPRKQLECVYKADQVPDRVRALIDKYKWEASLLNVKSSGAYTLSDKDVQAISIFLLSHHKPSAPVSQPLKPPMACAVPAPVRQAPPVASVVPPPLAPKVEPPKGHACRDCHSAKLTVEHGRYGYYFKCCDCGANTPIKTECVKCGVKERIRKSGKKFFAECDGCGASRSFHVNSIVVK